MKSFYTSWYRILLPACVLVLMLCFNFYIQSDSFYFSHFSGDQSIYVGLAEKLDKSNFKEYNLRGIDLKTKNQFVEYQSSSDTKGNLLRQMEGSGILFYDQDLFHNPPFFSYLIVFSHRLFSPKDNYKVLLKAASCDRKDALQGQFYCCIIPILSSALLLLCTFFIGKYLFSDTIGLMSAFLLMISPVQILASRRVWADTTLSFFVTFSILLFYLYLARKKNIFLISSSIVFACALLVKSSAVITIMPILVLYCVYKENLQENFLKKYLDLAVYFAIIFVITLPWYKNVMQVFGNPFFIPSQEGISKISWWFVYLKSRPWYTYLLGIPYQIPLYSLGYISICFLLFKKEKRKEEIFLGVWFLSYLSVLMYLISKSEILGPEHRYMLPAYPALAILSSNLINNIRIFLNKRFNAIISTSIITLLIGLCAVWSLNIVFEFGGFDIIQVPF